ncbi:hypothetical protein H5410_054636, partial [Solanum commersonii]
MKILVDHPCGIFTEIENTREKVISMVEKQVLVVDLEEICLTNNSIANVRLTIARNAQLIMHIKKEEAFWKQKAGMKWFQDGDSNTKFFHTIMNNKRRRLVLKKIKKDDNTWIEGSDEIAKEAINFFESQFSKDDSHKDFSILNCLP